MKKYIVTYAMYRGVELENDREELPPDARVLTRKQIEDAMGWPADVAAMRGVLDSLFGKGDV